MIEESELLLLHMARHFTDVSEGETAALLTGKAQQARKLGDLVRQAVLNQEVLSPDRLRDEAGAGSVRGT